MHLTYLKVRGFLVVVCVLAFCSTPSLASWNRIGNFSGQATAGYFFTPNEGFVCVSGITTTVAKVYYTNNGGNTWTAVSSPAWQNQTYAQFTCMWFSDRMNGWCSFLYGTTGSNLWHTSDGGISWQNTKFSGYPVSVRQTSAALIVTEFYGAGLLTSTDNGANWTTILGASVPLDGLSFSDNLHGVAGGFHSNYYFTSDGGLTWLPSTGAVGHESWGMYAIPNNPNVISVPEDNSSIPPSPVYRSTDRGVTWQQTSDILFKPTGDIVGQNGVLYIQNEGDFPPPGVYRSMDSGITWVNTGGPNPNNFDIRLLVVDCGTVIAFDDAGGVFRTMDGGDGSIRFCGLTNDTLKSMTASLCDSLKQQFFFHNFITDSVAVLDVRVIDSTRTDYTSKGIHFDSIPALYHVVKPIDSMGYSLGWVPGRYLHQAGNDSVHIRVIVYNMKHGGRDTFYFPLKLIALAGTPAFTLSTKQLNLGPIDICSSLDSSIQITNDGCDTLTITKASFVHGTSWQVSAGNGSPLTLPIRLLVGASTTIRIHYAARNFPGSADSLLLSLRQYGLDTSATVSLHGIARFKLPTIAQDSIGFGAVSTCAAADSLWKCFNTGCDTIVITAVDIDSSDWRLLQSNGSALKLPSQLLPQDSLMWNVHFVPTDLGARAGFATIHYRYFGIDTSTTISLRGFGKAVGKFDHSASLAFGAISECEHADSVLTFTNGTCGNIIVDSAWVTGAFNVVVAPLPDTLGRNLALAMHVFFTPTGKGPAQGAIYVRALVNGVEAVDTIPITGTSVAGTSMLVINPPLDSIDFATRSTCSTPDSIVFYCSNPGCDTLTLIPPTIEGAAAALSLAAMPAPVRLTGGDSIRIAVRLACLEGNYNGNLHLHFTFADGSIHDSLIPLRAIVTRGTKQLVLDTSRIDFGTATVCASFDTVIVYTNKGCLPLTIRSRSLTGNGFAAFEQLNGVVTLAPGESDTLHLLYNGQSTGALYSTLTIHSDADADSVRTIPLSINIIPRDSVKFALRISQSAAGGAEHVSVSLYPDRVVAGKSLTSIAGILTYRQDAFHAGSTTATKGINLTLANPYTNGDMLRQPFAIVAQGEVPLDPALPLFTQQFEVMISDSSSTPLSIDSLVLNGRDPGYGRCTLASAATGSTFDLSLTQCGDLTLQHDLAKRPLLSIAPVRPNPVLGDAAAIDVLTIEDGTLSITMTDALGRTVRAQTMSVRHDEPNTLAFDLARLPAGVYFYAIEMNSVTGKGALRTGSLSILR